MSAITTKFVTDHKLTNEMSLEEFSRYAPEIFELLPCNREKRRQAHDRFQKGYNFSKEQAFALIPSQRIGRTKKGETFRETAQRIMRNSFGEKEVKVIAKALAETSLNPVACILLK
ncbi:hypothetical protein RhiirA4_472096 [Rhizophagus irregularis]|uniref:Uncharacterized protein n=1 Tax=Rhizophagus irregularis TaxID=588596 RepID=A0A2I1H4F6_9GLOM|nr:hypothetical protein RhiirA4_472096 [Rhizophagus irregularis]